VPTLRLGTGTFARRAVQLSSRSIFVKPPALPSIADKVLLMTEA
jgi:hypothetical protein